MADPDDIYADGIHVRPVAYEVSVFPPGTESIDSVMWCITVAYRGHGKWGIYRGSGHGSATPCLSAAGEWHYEHIPSERTDEWLAEHRFTLEDAITLAREHAPKVTINGMTATEVAARHAQEAR